MKLSKTIVGAGVLAVLGALSSLFGLACGGSSAQSTSGQGGNAQGGQGQGGEAPQTEELAGDLTESQTLTSDRTWILNGPVHVKAGATLTIEAGTTIKGTKSPAVGLLVIEPGAKIEAVGTADAPIVFTSLAEPGDRTAGDWGGVVVLGKAPINVPGGTANVEGIEVSPATTYGGSDPADSSGTLRYVRIEFSGSELSPDNEINGLTFAGVGSGTAVDHIMVHQTLDDCFELFGGTVDAKYLVCANNGDDGFDWDFGYQGRLQFLALRQDPNIADDANGFEGDNDGDGSTNAPISEPTIYNVTLCGKGADLDKQQYGMLLRRSTKAHVANAIVTGFEAGLDVRNADTDVSVKTSVFFGNVVANVAYDETITDEAMKGLPTYDDDGGFDEVAEVMDPTNGNFEMDPGLDGCWADVIDFTPAATIPGGTAPPDDGFFDPTATFIGAFEAGDDWTAGAWVSFAVN